VCQATICIIFNDSGRGRPKRPDSKFSIHYNMTLLYPLGLECGGTNHLTNTRTVDRQTDRVTFNESNDAHNDRGRYRRYIPAITCRYLYIPPYGAHITVFTLPRQHTYNILRVYIVYTSRMGGAFTLIYGQSRKVVWRCTQHIIRYNISRCPRSQYY